MHAGIGEILNKSLRCDSKLLLKKIHFHWKNRCILNSMSLPTFMYIYTDNLSCTSSKNSDSIIDHTTTPRILEISSDISDLLIKRGNCKKI